MYGYDKVVSFLTKSNQCESDERRRRRVEALNTLFPGQLGELTMAFVETQVSYIERVPRDTYLFGDYLQWAMLIIMNKRGTQI